MSDIERFLEGQAYNASKEDKEPDNNVLYFIYDVISNAGQDGIDVIVNQFTGGYCYYFALMLKEAFPGGYIAWTRPYGHICYMYKGLPYDVTGIYMGEGEIVPYEQLCDTLEAFRHRGRDTDLFNEMSLKCQERGWTFEELYAKIYALIPDDQRLPITRSYTKEEMVRGDATRFFRKYKDMI